MNTKPQDSNIFDTGFPIPVVVVSVAVSNEQYGTDRALVANSVSYTCIYVYIQCRCWISDENGAIWAFIAPMLLIIMVCMVVKSY